jgi:hypothetical protein
MPLLSSISRSKSDSARERARSTAAPFWSDEERWRVMDLRVAGGGAEPLCTEVGEEGPMGVGDERGDSESTLAEGREDMSRSEKGHVRRER